MSDLIRYAVEDYSDLPSNDWLLEQGFLAASPAEAIRLINAQYGVVPNWLGTDCTGIVDLRREVARLDAGKPEPYTNALIIVAAHTHWKSLPIVCSRTSDDKYAIGPLTGTGPYCATGFVFHDDRPIPYEWADASCDISRADLALLWSFVRELNAAVIKAPWFAHRFRFGVSLNYRFKDCFAFPSTSTHEGPGVAPDELAYITRANPSHDLTAVSDDQVGWSSAIPPEISAEEAILLQEIEAIMLRP